MYKQIPRKCGEGGGVIGAMMYLFVILTYSLIDGGKKIKKSLGYSSCGLSTSGFNSLSSSFDLGLSSLTVDALFSCKYVLDVQTDVRMSPGGSDYSSR